MSFVFGDDDSILSHLSTLCYKKQDFNMKSVSAFESMFYGKIAFVVYGETEKYVIIPMRVRFLLKLKKRDIIYKKQQKNITRKVNGV